MSTAYAVMHKTYYSNDTVYAICLTEESARDLVRELETTITDRDFELYTIKEAELVL